MKDKKVEDYRARDRTRIFDYLTWETFISFLQTTLFKITKLDWFPIRKY